MKPMNLLILLVSLLASTSCGPGGAQAVGAGSPPPVVLPPAPPPPPPAPPPPPPPPTNYSAVVGGLTLYGGAGGMAPHVVHVRPNLGAYDWTVGTIFATDDHIGNSDGSVVYKCLSNHTSDASTEPGVGSSWTTRWAVSGSTGSGFWGEGRWQYQFVKADGSPLEQADRDWMRVKDPISGELVYMDDRYSPAPTAAFVFRSPGSYKVRLRYQNRDKDWSDWVESAPITIAENTRTKKFVNGATGSDTYDGMSATVGNGHGPKATVNSALALVNGNNFEIEIADDTTCDCAMYSNNVAGNTGVWVHRSGGGAKPIVVLKQPAGYAMCQLNHNSIVEGIEFGYSPIPSEPISGGRRIGVELAAHSVNTAIIDCDYDEVYELASGGSATFPTAILFLRLLQKKPVTRYCVFMDGFHVFSIIGCTFDQGCMGEHVIRLSSQESAQPRPYDINKWFAAEYDTFDANPNTGGQGKSAFGTAMRHLGAYRCRMARGSVVIGCSPTSSYKSIKNSVIDNCWIKFDNTSSQACHVQGFGQNVIRASVFESVADHSGAIIGFSASGANRFLNLSVRDVNNNGNNALFYNLYGPTDDVLVRGCVWSLDPANWFAGQPRFYPAPENQLLGIRWEDNVHTDMTAVRPEQEFRCYESERTFSFAQAEASEWADGNVQEDHTFDLVTWETLGAGTSWRTKVRSGRGVFRSINGLDWTTAGPAGAWYPANN